MKSALRPFGRIVMPFFTPSTRTSRLMRSQTSTLDGSLKRAGDDGRLRCERVHPLGIREASQNGLTAWMGARGGLEIDEAGVDERARGHGLRYGNDPGLRRGGTQRRKHALAPDRRNRFGGTQVADGLSFRYLGGFREREGTFSSVRFLQSISSNLLDEI